MKQYYHSNYHGMAANCHDIFIIRKASIINTVISNIRVIDHGILTLEKVGTGVNYHGIFITLALGVDYLKYSSKFTQSVCKLH